MMQVGLRTLLWPVVIAAALLFGTGIFQIQKPTYSCFNGKRIHFDKKVPVVSLGNFRVNAYPLVHDCSKDEQYDPTVMYKCSADTFCYGQEKKR